MRRREFLFGTLASALAPARLFSAAPADYDPNLSVFVSDVHVPKDGGHQERYFRSVVAEILKLTPLPKRVVCFGDLSHLYGFVEDYRRSRPLFEPLRAAGIELVFGHGNHDRRDEFLEVWPEYAGKSPVPGRFVSETDLGTCDLVMLDTLWEPKKGSRWITNGQLKGEQAEWLLAELKRRTRPFVLGAHHPLLSNEIEDADVKAIRDAISRSPACFGWINGHDHVWRTSLFCGSYMKYHQRVFKRMLTLPSTGHWGDIGFVVVRAEPHVLRAELAMRDHFFPTPDRRCTLDEDIVAEKRNLSMTFRF